MIDINYINKTTTTLVQILNHFLEHYYSFLNLNVITRTHIKHAVMEIIV